MFAWRQIVAGAPAEASANAKEARPSRRRASSIDGSLRTDQYFATTGAEA